MSPFARALSLGLAAVMLAALTAGAPAEPVTLTAADKVKVFATYYGTGDKSKPIVLLFPWPAQRRRIRDHRAQAQCARLQRAGLTRSIVCGSSYSASLVFLLAADNPGKIAGLMAFSPGEYLGGAHTVRNAAAKLKDIAVFVSSASDRSEIAAAALSSMRCRGTRRHNSYPSVPASASALREDANPSGYQQVWVAVERFLMPLR